MRIPGGHEREAPHAMITGGGKGARKRREGGGPEGKHIAFVPNSPSLDPDAPCPRRWGIEISYKMPRQTRMRTPARRACQDLLLCGVAHGAQRAGHAALGQGGRRGRPADPEGGAQLSRCWSSAGVRRPAVAAASAQASPLGGAHIPTFGMCGPGRQAYQKPCLFMQRGRAGAQQLYGSACGRARDGRPAGLSWGSPRLSRGVWRGPRRLWRR